MTRQRGELTDASRNLLRTIVGKTQVSAHCNQTVVGNLIRWGYIHKFKHNNQWFLEWSGKLWKFPDQPADEAHEHDKHTVEPASLCADG